MRLRHIQNDKSLPFWAFSRIMRALNPCIFHNYQYVEVCALLAFSFPPAEVSLKEGDIHCWLVDMPEHYSSLERIGAVLSSEEIERASRFVRTQDADNYRVSHGALRCILSRYVDSQPQDLNFVKSKHGKPALTGELLKFNMSHSGDLAVIAVSAVGEVGVDIECGRENTEYLDIAKRFFTAREFGCLEGIVDVVDRRKYFLKLWACKESYIKATGLGMMESLDSFDVVEVSLGQMQLQVAGRCLEWCLEAGALDWRERHYALAIASRLRAISRFNWMWTPLIGE